MCCFCNVDWREKTHRAENPHPFRAVTIFGHQRRQATCSTRSDGHVDAMPLRPSSAISTLPPALSTIFGRQRRQARPTRRPRFNISPFRVVVARDFRLNSLPLRAVTIFAVASHAKIPSTPHNDPRASAPVAPNKKGDPPDRPYEIAHCPFSLPQSGCCGETAPVGSADRRLAQPRGARGFAPQAKIFSYKIQAERRARTY